MFKKLVQIDTKYQSILILFLCVFSLFSLQSFGHFELTYDQQIDETPLNGDLEIQQIVYKPPFGNNIVNEETGKLFNTNPTEQLSFAEKFIFYYKAFLQIADKAFLYSLFISITFFLVKSFSSRLFPKKKTHNIENQR